MLEPDLIELFVGPLQSAGIRYFISGSVAAMLYGEPRGRLNISGDQIDRAALDKWTRMRGVKAEWRKVTP